VRHLTEQFAVGALRRGQLIQQFLGPVTNFEQPGIRYAEIRPGATYDLYLSLAEDIGHERFFDVGEFPSLEVRAEDQFGRLVARLNGPVLALDVAEQLLGACRNRWVNVGVVETEYAEYLRAGRPAFVSEDGFQWPVEVDPPSLVSRGRWL
jgi:hypothetical protein